jgi:hypothetical protein
MEDRDVLCFPDGFSGYPELVSLARDAQSFVLKRIRCRTHLLVALGRRSRLTDLEPVGQLV